MLVYSDTNGNIVISVEIEPGKPHHHAQVSAYCDGGKSTGKLWWVLEPEEARRLQKYIGLALETVEDMQKTTEIIHKAHKEQEEQ